MRSAVLLVLVSAVFVAAVYASKRADVVDVKTQFANFIQTYNKKYSASEYSNRFRIFRQNLKEINKLNAKDSKATYGINEFADMTADEFKVYKMAPAPKALIGISCLANGVVEDELDTEFPGVRELAAPSSWDWRAQGMVTPIKNQGMCGSCWTFSTTGAIESAYAIKYHPSTLLELSEQEIVDCSTACDNEPPYGQVCDGGCDGGWPWLAMTDIMSWGGLATEAQYPYTGVTGTCGRTSAMKSAPIKNYTCLSGSGLASNGLANETYMMNFCYVNGPLSIALNANPLQFYTGGVITDSASECDPQTLDHAILIVGYGTLNGTPMWIVKNSWGTSWGLNGYFYLERGANTCGVASAVTFPIVK